MEMSQGAALVAGKVFGFQGTPLTSAAGLVTGAQATSASITGADAQSTQRSVPAAQTADMSEDITLVRRTLSGDQEAFAHIVEKYKDPVYNVAYRMLGNATEAEDVAQEAFVRAYTQLRTYKDTHRFSTWLLSIASHLSIDQLRRRRFLALPLENAPFLEWIADLGAGPEQSAMEGETHDEMQGILNTLPTKYRLVLLLRYWYDFSYDEIARELNLTPALVKARLHRARELVARTLKAQGINFSLASEDADLAESTEDTEGADESEAHPAQGGRAALAH